jgi:NADPH-dependent ferric siderophore reductase
MRLVPYTYESKKRLTRQIHTIRVLLEGQALWTEESVHTDPIRLALEPNDLYVRTSFAEQGTSYFEIDTGKTDLNNMYTYKECDPATTQLCWNTFHIITDERGSPFIDIPYPFLRTILKAHYVVPTENGASE